MNRTIPGPSRRRLALGALLLLAASPAARAALFTPTDRGDSLDGACDFHCSLREAIAAANASPGPDVVVLGSGLYALSLAGAGEDLGAGGDLDVIDDLVLIGAGAGQTILDGRGIDRVVDLHGARLEIVGVTLRGGRVAGAGAGLRNDGGELVLNRSVVTDNAVNGGGGFGGGIWSLGTLSVVESTVHANFALSGGGVAADGAFRLVNSTVSGNFATSGFGGGLYLFDDLDGTIANATITGNTASQRGGGAFVESAAFIGGSPGFRNTILAGNFAATEIDCSGAARSEGYNLVGVGLGCNSFSAAENDLVGTPASPVVPGLLPLAGNGGPTPTHDLLPASPAINAGNPSPPGSGGAACELVDQRGAARPGSGTGPGPGATRCDVGAVETTLACVAGGTSLCFQNGRFRATAQWTTNQGQTGPAQGVQLTDDSGYFWFFSPENIEVTIKNLDACVPPFNRFWVFLSGLTNVRVELTVTDTATGVVKTYLNPLNRPFQPVLDTNAFATCP